MCIRDSMNWGICRCDWFIYRAVCSEPHHLPCREQVTCINCQLSWNTWEILCAESPAQTLISAGLGDGHWCSPLLSLSQSHLETARSQCLGGQWDSVLAPGSFLGHSAGPQRKRNNSVQLWGSVREKEEMDIMTCMENTRKAFISTTANKCRNSL